MDDVKRNDPEGDHMSEEPCGVCLYERAADERYDTPAEMRVGELSDLLGHDSVGHRVAKALRYQRITTREALRRFTDEQLFAMRGLGLGGMQRIHERVEHCTTFQPLERQPEPCAFLKNPQDHPGELHDLLGHGRQGHRTINALWRDGVFTVEALRQLSEDDLKDIRGLGPGGIQHIHDRLNQQGDS